MKTIYKYRLSISDECRIQMPMGHEILHVGLDPNEAPCIWALVDSAHPSRTETFHVVGTGNPMPTYSWGEPSLRHVGSIRQGPFMWHVFVVEGAA
jgi:hypothetical protein